MRPKVNWRFLLKVGVALAVCLVATHFVHRWQVRKQVDVYLHHADTARAATPPDTGRELAFLRRYVAARPDDSDARERLARAMVKAAKGARQLTEAYLVIEDVLRRDPGRDELRRFAIDTAMDVRVGLFPEARGHIELLLQKRPDDGELEGLYALCLAREGKYKSEGESLGAVDWYTKSIRHRPDLIESYAGKAVILRTQLKREDEAHQVVADMLSVKANADNYRAHVLTAGYWRAFGKPAQPAASVAKPLAEFLVRQKQIAPDATVEAAIAVAVGLAQKCAPDELDVLLLAADVASTRARALAREGKDEESRNAVAEVRRLLARATERHPKAAAVYLAAAALEVETGSATEAVAAIRKGMEAVSDVPELAVALLDYLIRAGDAAGAEEVLGKLKGGGLAPVLIDYEQARILVLREQWLDAAVLLESARRDVGKDAGLARRIDLLLGRCYAQVGEEARRLEAFTRAVPEDLSDPLWVPAKVGVAEAQAALGMADEALATYKVLNAWVQVGQFELLRALRASAEKPDLAPVRAAIAEAERAYKDRPAERVPTELHLLRVDVLNVEKKPEARSELEALRAQRPKDVAVRIAIARQDLREKNPKRAHETLDAAQKEFGDSPDLRIARARVWVESKEADLPAKLAALAVGLDKFSRAQQRRLLRDLASLAAANGADEVSGRLWDQLAGVQRDDLGVHLVRFDRALQNGREDAAAAIAQEIRRVDGETGPFTRLTRAVLLIWKAQVKKDKSGLDTALQLLGDLAQEQKRWSRVALGQALIYDLRAADEQAPDARAKALDAALAMYENAFAWGDTNPQVLRRLVELLAAKSRFRDADAVLVKLGAAAAANPDFQRVAAEVRLKSDNPKAAIESASKAVAADSKNPRDQLWLGRLYWSAGEKEKAEGPLRRAVELAPADAEGWLVLVRYLAATGRKEEAEKVLGAAQDRVERDERPLFVALAHAQLGQIDKAADAFRAARAARPDHLRTLQAHADFLFQTGKLKEAREAFERIIGLRSASPVEQEFTRSMLALTYAVDSDYEVSRKGLEVLGLINGGTRPPGIETPAQRRSRALVLALQRDRASKLEAIRLFEEDRSSIALNDQFLVAQLHLATGNKAQVRVVMTDLLAKPGAAKVAPYVAFYAAWLLSEGDLREADVQVKRLKEVQADALQTAELEARLLAAKKELPAARKVLLAKAEPAGAPVGLLARVCEDIGLHDDAEQLLKRFVAETKATRPQTVLSLASFYGRRGRVADALRVCEGAPAQVPAPAVGDVMVNVLYAVPAAEPADVKRVAAWLEAAIGKADPKAKGALVQQLASIRNLQGDYAGAIDQFRRALEADERDALAMNNLAFLLSTAEGKHDEALRLIEKARRIVGPVPDLLDTEAIVRFQKGEIEAARKILTEVLAGTPTASGYFHLTQVEHKAQRELEARIAWRRARELGLAPTSLHPTERKAYAELNDTYGGK